MFVHTASRVPHRTVAALLTVAAAVAALLALGGATATPAQAAMTRCADVAFTPNSDDVAASIRTKDVSCRYARDFIRDSGGRPGARYRGFTCERRSIEPAAGLPYLRFQCVRGARAIHFKRF